MTRRWLTPSQISLIGFVAILLLAWICYRPALSGAFQLDDMANLGGLATIEDTSSAVNFIFSGTAGPGGRPLALLSFSMQADSWEQGARAFLQVNILIHLFNAMLLAACFYWLSLLQAIDRNKAALIATIAAGMWVVMPLLASASLLVVQRMTTLSASFALLGLLFYLLARARIGDRPRNALIMMSASLVLGTGLAALVKESGLLLPLYVLVLEATVLGRPATVSHRHWRAWQGVFLLLPTLLVVVYVLSRFGYPDSIIAWRGFTAGERLMTESQILWVYLHKAFLGIPSELGIFQMKPPLSRSILEPATLLSALAWLVLLAGALVWRRRLPLVALAVLWFLGGHIIESTVVPLELYFEHRNYLPIAGPVFALTAFLALGSDVRQRVLWVVAPLYLVTSAFSLYSVASLAGEPSTSSRYWAVKYPDSVRAVTTMATFQLSEEGPVRALQTLDQFVLRHPGHAYLRIQELNLRCMFLPHENHDAVLGQLQRDLPGVDFTLTAGTMLSQLFDTVAAVDCNGVGPNQVGQLARVLQSNPRYALVPNYNQFHYKLLAGIARQQGQLQDAIANLEKAMAAQRSSELNMMMVTALGGAGEFEAARDFIDEAKAAAPINPVRSFQWRRDLENLREYIDELERYSGQQE
jgi:hypothetical protein